MRIVSQNSLSERLLLFIALSHVIAGLALSLLPLSPGLQQTLASAIFSTDKASDTVMFLISVFGPTLAGWGVLFYALVRAYFRHPTRDSWRALVWSILPWAPLDSALSIRYGLHAAAVLNAVIAVIILWLLFNIRNIGQC